MIKISITHLFRVAALVALLVLPANASAKALYTQPQHLQPTELQKLSQKQLNQVLQGFKLERFTLTLTDSTLKLGETANVELVVRPKKLSPLHTEGEAKVKVAEIMLARLEGFGVEIKSLSSEEQLVRAPGDTRWHWSIRATEKGTHTLTATLTALVTVDGVERKQDIRTLNESVIVQVTLGDRVAGFFAGNWQWLWAAILIPAVGWLMQQRKAKRGQRASG